MRVLRYAWGLPVAAAVFWLGGLLQGEQQGDATQTEWQQSVNAQLEKLSTQQQDLEVQVKQILRAPGANVAGAIREQTQKVTAELKNITLELRQLRRVR